MTGDRSRRASVLVPAAAALLVRVAVVLSGWSANPLVSHPPLDGQYYLTWARDVAGGDLAGTGGIVGGGAWILNPLYAYALAPLAAVFDDPLLPALLAQCVLGAATTALAATAARRCFGTAAAWTAGLSVAFCAPLVQLTAHVAVSELAAFLTAGAALACAPPPLGRAAGRTRPAVTGGWLGVGALARPITPLALPLVAWLERRRAGWRGAALCVAVFFACALPSLVRNWAVTGEPHLYTAAGGLNVHLGNNPAARANRSMSTPHFRFSPTLMHADARLYVWEALGREPTPAEVSDYFTRKTIDEALSNPGPSALHYLNKARWFLSPTEVPSSVSLATDRAFAPVLHAAFVPTFVVAAAGLVGLWLHRRRPEVLLGPGALVLAHLAVLTLVFPLSHYRTPAVPALAVLAGGAVAWCRAAWRDGRRRAVLGAAGAMLLLAAAGAAPPQPDALREADQYLVAITYRDMAEEARTRGDLDRMRQLLGQSEERAERAIEVWREGRAERGEFAPGWFLLGELAFRRRDHAAAVERITRGLAAEPEDWTMRLTRSLALQHLGRLEAAQEDAEAVARRYPELPHGRARLGEVLAARGRVEEARPHLRYALERGFEVDPAAARLAGLR